MMHVLTVLCIGMAASGTGLEAALEGRPFSSIPASFVYGSTPSTKCLADWPRSMVPPESVPGGTRYAATWTAPDGFTARLGATVYDSPPALELRWTFSNAGSAPSERITEAYAIDLDSPSLPGRCVLHSCTGGGTGELNARPGRAGFELSHTPLGGAKLSVAGGRSSNGHLPFFCLESFADSKGIAAALGWSGQWSAQGAYDPEKKRVHFRAGMDPVGFRLPPGETVRMPSALFIPFSGSYQNGTNALRRVLRSRYQGRLDGQLVASPVSFSTWFVFHNEVSAAMLTEMAEAAAPLGVEYICLDAGWFDGDFPKGVGNWTVNQEKFPRGLKVVADQIHDMGMKFGLWFEPERVTEGTIWHKEHGDLLFKARAAGERLLLDLGKPEARRLIVDMISRYVSEVGVDWIRYDFNIAPLGFWEAAEGEEEKGLAQLRYMNGLYQVFEELMARHPNLLIEQCASGGRRIDLETVRYGHTFWKSDHTRSVPLMRFHETGGNTLLPASMLNTNYCESVSEGDILSLFAGPLGFGLDVRALSAHERKFLKKAITAYKEVRTYSDGDYYPLFKQSRSQTDWCGWLFRDPETAQGVIIAYRPVKSPDPSAILPLPEVMKNGQDLAFESVIGGERHSISAEGLRVDLDPGEGGVWRFGPK